MKTVTVDVGGLLSTLSARGVEEQLCKLSAVSRVDVSSASQPIELSATAFSLPDWEGRSLLRRGLMRVVALADPLM